MGSTIQTFLNYFIILLKFHCSYRPTCSLGDGGEDYYNVHYKCLIIEVSLDKSGPPEIDLVFKEVKRERKKSVSHSVGKVFNKTLDAIRDSLKPGEGTLILYKDESTLGVSGICHSTHKNVLQANL